MTDTARLGITLLEEAQASKEVSINDGFEVIDDRVVDREDVHTVADTGTADTEFTVAHGLGATPTGYIVVSIDKAGIVYKGSTAWDATNMYLKCSAANAALKLIPI